MALTVQNLRAIGNGVEPASLLPGQIAFNITDKILYVGDGSNTKTSFDGTQASGVPGEGWYSMPMDFASLGDYYVVNPEVYGDTPTDQQVLTWSDAYNHPIWTSGGGGGSNQVYITDNATVAAASGATVSDKITTAIGVASPDEGNVTIVTGLPDDVYEGLYFFTTEWVRGASYAYPSASEVIYDNTAHPGLTATVQGAISDLDDGLAATTAIANTANSTANSALSIASAALPKAGGTMVGTIVARNIDIQTSYFLQFNGGGDGQIFGITDSTVFNSSTTAASAKAVADTYAVAAAALPVAGGIMTGPITFAAGQIFPVSGIQDATYIQKGVVQVGTNIDVLGGVISVATSSLGNLGVVQLNNLTNSTSTSQAATANAVKLTYDLATNANNTANAAVPRASYTASGDLVVGTGAGTFTHLTAGPADYILASTGAGTLAWVSQSEGDVTGVTGTAPVTVDNLDPQNPIIGVNQATTATTGVVQVDVLGNINIASGVITVPNASTTVRGAVQLYNGVDSGSTTLALTAAQGQFLQGQIDTLTLSNSVILAGGYDATTGLVDGVTSQGTTAGFADGFAPPAADATTVDHYLICTAAGNNPSAMENGDWLLAVETSPGVYAYQVLGVGARPAVASYTQVGVTQLADGAAVLAGTADSLAITPQALQDNVIDSVTTANSNQIASATAVKTANDNALAAQSTANAALPKAGGTMTGSIVAHDVNVQTGYSILFANGLSGTVNAVSDSTSTTSSTTAASSTAVKAAYDAGAAAIPCSTITATGDILAGVGAVPTALPVGTDGQVLVANSACATGLEWVTDVPGDVTSVSGTSPITVDNTDPQNPAVGIDAASVLQPGAVQLDDTVTSISVTEAATANAAKTAYDAGVQGQADAAAAQVTADQAVLDAAAAQATADAAVPCASFTALGEILAGTGSGTYSALPVGANGQFLAANSGTGTGLEWCTLSLACVPCSAFTAAGQLLAGTGTSTFTALNVGSNNQFLVADSACTGGLKWLTAQGALLCGFTCTATPFNTVLGGLAGAALTGLSVANTAIGYAALDSETSGDFNVAIGHNALTAQNGASGNTVIGGNAGAQVTSGSSNTFVGCSAGDVATTGSFNLAVGPNALGATTTGSCNVAIGSNSLLGVTTVNLLTAVGVNSLCGNTTGTQNTGVGWSVLSTNTTGSNNTALGYRAGVALSGSNNTIVGNNAGAALGVASGNTLIGNSAGVSLTTGACNTLVGGYTGTTTLSNNVVLSDGAGTIRFQANQTGAWSPDGTNFGTAGQFLASNGTVAAPSWCTLSLACIPCAAFTTTGQLLAGTGSSTFSALTVGTNGQFLSANSACSAGLEWCTLSLACVPCSAFTAAGQLLAGTGANTFTSLNVGTNGQVLIADSACTSGVKWGASLQGYTCAATPFNTALGTNAGDSITSGTDNVTLGYNAGTAITTGSQNVVIGSGAAVSSNAVGVVAVGFCSGQALTTGGCITHIGYVSGRNSTGASNTYVGALTGCAASNTSACGTLLGFCAGSALTTGNGNILVGFQTGRNVNSGANNVAIGTAAFQTATTATNNVAVGCGALSGLSTSSGNTALGHRAMLNASTAANNVAVGCNAGEQLSTGSNNVLIGDSAGDTITTGTQNTFVGSGSGGLVATTSEGNTGLGFSALGQGVTSGAYNTAVGNSAGLALTSGALNTLIGYTAGQAITTGGSNTLVGRYVGTSTLANNVVLSDGAGTIRFQSNASGAISLGAGGTYGTAGQILVSGGSGAAPVWTSSGTAAANYGSFVRTTTQTNAGGASGNAVSYDTTSSANNFSIVSGSRITAAVAGTYQILASLQVQKTDAGSDDVNFWIKKNGVNEPNSAYNLTLQGSGAAQLGYINWVVTLAAGEYVELWWYSADANARLLTDPAVAPYPAVPASGFIIHPMGA
jgi:hypothetical protein